MKPSGSRRRRKATEQVARRTVRQRLERVARKKGTAKVSVRSASPLDAELNIPGQSEDSPPTPSAATSTFEPSKKQLAYLFALREAVSNGGSGLVSDVAMATRLKMSRTTIWEWKHDPEFRAWLSSVLTMERDVDWDLVLDKHHQLAIRGSVRSAEFLAKVRSLGLKGGGFNDSTDVDQSVSNYTVQLLVPRPPALPVPGGER